MYACICEVAPEAKRHTLESIVEPISTLLEPHILYPLPPHQQHLSSPPLPPTFTPEGRQCVWPCVRTLRGSLQKLVVSDGSEFVKCWGMFEIDRYFCVCMCVFAAQRSRIRRYRDDFVFSCPNVDFTPPAFCGCFSKRPMISCVSCAVKFSLDKKCFLFVPQDQMIQTLFWNTLLMNQRKSSTVPVGH